MATVPNQFYIGRKTDATCYESRISFPTDVKLIWNCCHEVYLLIQQQRKLLKLRKSRMNYMRQKQFFQSYQKTRKKQDVLKRGSVKSC